jgi:ceramide glucosyltransferase
VALSDSIVTTNLGAGSWRDVGKHQVRWSRTIRVSRPAGYQLTHLTFWCVIAALAGHWEVALAGELVRVIAAAATMWTMGDENWPSLAFVPFRDLFGFAVWYAGMVGDTVEWRGIRFRLRRDGRIEPV